MLAKNFVCKQKPKEHQNEQNENKKKDEQRVENGKTRLHFLFDALRIRNLTTRRTVHQSRKSTNNGQNRRVEGTYANGLRFVLTILGGTIAVMGSRVIGYTSAGALGCVTTAFIARIGWRREESKLTPQQLQAHQIASVPKRLDLLWKFLKPVSFALIGKEINFNVLQGHVIGYGALLVLVGSLFRLGFAYLSTYGGNLSRKERAYITISGFPKATVQAALGPVALDLARAASVANEAQLALAGNVLIISVLAIIFTAPLGAILMLRLAPHWLKHGDAVEEANDATTPTPTVPEAPHNAHKRA